MASELQSSPLLSLPRELRDLIWAEIIDYPNLKHLIAQHHEEMKQAISTHFETGVFLETIERLSEWTSIELPRRPELGTPALLLLNRQVTTEALEILRDKCCLMINTPVNAVFRRDVRPLEVADFITDQTLTTVRHARIEVNIADQADANHWHRTLSHLFGAWNRKNELRKLTIFLKELKLDFKVDGSRQLVATYKLVKAKLLDFKDIAAVEFEGQVMLSAQAERQRSKRTFLWSANML